MLDHLPTVADAERALAELHRVAEYVWICVPSRWSLGGNLNPDHHLWVDRLPDGRLSFEQRDRAQDYGAVLWGLLGECWRAGDALVAAVSTGRPIEEFL